MPNIRSYGHNGEPRIPKFTVPRQHVDHEVASFLAYLESNQTDKAADHLRNFTNIAHDLVARSRQHVAKHSAGAR